MKIEILKEFIKKTVQHEVREIVQSEIKRQLSEMTCKKTSIKSKKNSILEDEILNEMEEMDKSVIEEEVKPTKKFVKYTNNPVLNDILNQTTGGIPQEGGLVNTMGGYEKIGGQEVITETKVPDNAPEPVKTVYSAINRDYRSLMKAVNKKRGEK